MYLVYQLQLVYCCIIIIGGGGARSIQRCAGLVRTAADETSRTSSVCERAAVLIIISRIVHVTKIQRVNDHVALFVFFEKIQNKVTMDHHSH